jgi:hypothetical protein
MTKEADGPFARVMPQLINLANSHPVFGQKKDTPSAPDDMYDLVRSVDMVWAIWEDTAQPLGHSAILVKGYDKLRELYALLAQPRVCEWPWTMTAFKCVDADWAERLGDLIQQFFPDNQTH